MNIKELADIGAAAARKPGGYNWLSIDPDNQSDEKQRQAFAQAVKDEVEKPLLERIRELETKPTPPVVDGKTPAEIAVEGFISGGLEYFSWSTLPELTRNCWRSSASAVLAAFGGKQLVEAQTKLDYVHNMGLRFGMMTSSDKPEPYLAHTWTDDSDHERIFREWSEGIGWQARAEKAEAELERIIAAAHEAGWNGVENSKDLALFIRYLAEDEAKAKADLEHIFTVARQAGWKNMEKSLALFIKDTANLPQLRPLSEAGELPVGYVRVTGYKSQHTECGWILGEDGSNKDTHFADIRLPAQHKPEPTTFEAHGKTWTLPAPPEGQQWHRTDWTEDMLPEGWRPLLLDEPRQRGDQFPKNQEPPFIWAEASGPPAIENKVKENWCHHRTRRPLPTPPALIPLDVSDIRAADEFRPCVGVFQICPLHHADETHVTISEKFSHTRLSYPELAANHLRRQHGSDEWKPCTKEAQP